MSTSVASTARKIYDILTPAERRSGASLLVLMTVGMVLETLSLGLVVPAIALMLQDDPGVAVPRLRPLLLWLGNPTQRQLVIGGMTTIFAAYLVKTAFLAGLAVRQSRFAFGVQARVSQQLFDTYLRQPYAFHLNRNSGQLIHNAISEVHLFTDYCMVPGLLLLTEGLVLLGTAALLLAVQPLGALVIVTVMGGSGWAFQRVMRARSARWGHARQHHEAMRTQYVQEGLGAAKEVRMLGREAYFLARYSTHNVETGHMYARQFTLQSVARLSLELLAVASLAVLVSLMLAQQQPIAGVVSTLGLFAAAAFRVMPSANRVLAAVHSVHYGASAVDTLHRELQLAPVASPPPVPVPREQRPLLDAIALEGVTYTYPDTPVPSLHGVSLRIARNETIGFVGESGAGKSTLVDVILGLLTPQAGRVLVDGEDIQANLRRWQDQIGYVPQTVYLTDDTFRRNIAFGLADAAIDEMAVVRAVRAAQLEEFIAGLSDGLDTLVGERGVRLSGGQRQRIGIARALYADPGVLVLDEATSALDTVTEESVMAAVTALQHRKTILIVAHRLSTVARCHRVYQLEGGDVVDERTPEPALS